MALQNLPLLSVQLQQTATKPKPEKHEMRACLCVCVCVLESSGRRRPVLAALLSLLLCRRVRARLCYLSSDHMAAGGGTAPPLRHPQPSSDGRTSGKALPLTQAAASAADSLPRKMLRVVEPAALRQITEMIELKQDAKYGWCI